MSWDYRVMRHIENITDFCPEGVTTWYGVHEVYYDEEGNIDGWTKDAIVTGDNLEDLKWKLDHMPEALDKPVLEYNEAEE